MACSDDDSGSGGTGSSTKPGGGGANGGTVTSGPVGNGSSTNGSLTGNATVVGDSLAYGTGAEGSNFTPSICISQLGYITANMAVPGQTSVELLNQISFYISPAPSFVFISTGGNDAIMNYYQPGTYPEANSFREITQIVRQFRNAGSVVAYLALNPPLDAASAQRLQRMTQLAASEGAIIVDGMNGLWNTDKMADQFHPNELGYAIMCDRILQSVRPYLK